MLNLVKAVAFNFLGDDVSTSLSIDLSLQPADIDFRGAPPTGIVSPAVTLATVPVACTADLVGTVLTLTFAAALAELNGQGAINVYSFTGYLKFGA